MSITKIRYNRYLPGFEGWDGEKIVSIHGGEEISKDDMEEAKDNPGKWVRLPEQSVSKAQSMLTFAETNNDLMCPKCGSYNVSEENNGDIAIYNCNDCGNASVDDLDAVHSKRARSWKIKPETTLAGIFLDNWDKKTAAGPVDMMGGINGDTEEENEDITDSTPEAGELTGTSPGPEAEGLPGGGGDEGGGGAPTDLEGPPEGGGKPPVASAPQEDWDSMWVDHKPDLDEEQVNDMNEIDTGRLT